MEEVGNREKYRVSGSALGESRPPLRPTSNPSVLFKPTIEERLRFVSLKHLYRTTAIYKTFIFQQKNRFPLRSFGLSGRVKQKPNKSREDINK